MKRILQSSSEGRCSRSNLLFLNLLIPLTLSAAPVLFEAYFEGTITIPSDRMDTVTVVELSFSVDTACPVQFAAGGLVGYVAKGWLELDGERLFPLARGRDVSATSVLIVYTYLLTPGNHIICFRGTKGSPEATATFYDAYLQALIFLPDEPDAVTEQPEVHEMHSVVSQGPWVSAPGATELVDATGRIIENAIEEDKVFISNLSTGTYFARDEDRTVVKIVKVE